MTSLGSSTPRDGLAIEYVAPGELQAAPYNPRTITAEGIKRLSVLLDVHGFVDPVIARREDKLIIGGHQRIKANAMREHPDPVVPVVFLDGISDERAKALNIALNNQEAQGQYDMPKLADLLQTIDTGEFDVPSFTAFSEDDIAGLMHGLDEFQVVEDEAPEVQEDAVSQTGDLWVMGEHRLLCGDSTKAHPQTPVTVFADPPYGIAFEAMRGGDAIANDANPADALAVTTAALLQLKNATAFFVCCDWRSLSTIAEAMVLAGIHPKACIVWDKMCGVQNLDRFYKQHEFIVYAGPYGGERTLYGDVWQFKRDYDPDHPTPKPVGLVARAVQATTSDGDLVCDPFSGSGTTIIACEQLSRRCFAMEIEPRYVDVAVRRWQNLTGVDAVLDGDGRTFAEIESERL